MEKKSVVLFIGAVFFFPSWSCQDFGKNYLNYLARVLKSRTKDPMEF